MGRAEIAAALQAIIASVDGMGQVHKRERFSPDWSTYLSRFEYRGKINGCMFTRKSTVKRQRTLGEVEKCHVFIIRLFYGFQDDADSDAVFQTMVDQVATAVDADETLNGTCETTHPDWGPMRGAVGLQVENIDIRQFGKVLCHYAECRLCACETTAV